MPRKRFWNGEGISRTSSASEVCPEAQILRALLTLARNGAGNTMYRLDGFGIEAARNDRRVRRAGMTLINGFL